jgi:hypothetical protein
VSARLAWGLIAAALAMLVAGVAFALAASVSVTDRLFAVGIILVSGAVGAMVVSRQPRNPIGWIFTGAAFVSGLAALADGYAWFWLEGEGGERSLGELAAAFQTVSWMPIVLLPLTFLLLLFPDGRLLSRRWRPIAWCAGLGIVGAIVSTGLADRPLEDFPQLDNPYGIGGDLVGALEGLSFLLIAVALVGSPLSLYLRFRGAALEERQQIKWLVWAGAVAAATFAVGVPMMAVWGDSVSNAAILTAVLAIAVATAIAILRYRLYDVDVVINRTLVYAGVTLTLAAAYVGSVLLLQVVLSPGSDLAVAASTLAVAALFRPARSRIQELVDRRFYRSRYDAARTLERFGARLRDQVDLDALGGELRGVAAQTMQPQHVSLWLREPPR